MAHEGHNHDGPTRPQQPAERVPGVKHVIAIGSGKGGVGKSTVAVNLACALAKTGAKTGVVDADIYGPSIPTMLGLKGQKPLIDQERRKMFPLEAHDLKVMSMGFMLEDADPVVWRGPMLGKALQQFFEDVDWGELDYLVVDLPPGTGDVQLSLAQLIPVEGAVVVTTPQDVAHADVTRAVSMFRMLKTPMMGVVENMSYFLCPDNNKKYHIFGEGRTGTFAENNELEVLAELPIDLAVAPSGDAGIPITVGQPDGEQAKRYNTLAQNVIAKINALAEVRKKGSRTDSFFSMNAQ
jgi:ATP-binding protein involved in chromosome partitioning